MSDVWNKIFSEREWGVYPPEAMVRLAVRYVVRSDSLKGQPALELACGPAAALSHLLAKAGLTVTASDISSVAIEKARGLFRNQALTAEFVEASFLSLPFPNSTFGAALETEGLTSINAQDFEVAIREVARVLKPGGIHISFTAAAGSWGQGTGTRVDEYSESNVQEGPYAGPWVTRFSTPELLTKTYENAGFEVLELEEQWRTLQNRMKKVGNYMIVVRKKSAN